MDNYIAASQEQNMRISVRDDSSSIDFDMVDFENFDEVTDSYEDADMEVENERMATYFLPVRTLTAVDNLAITGENIAENHASIWHQPQVEVPQKVRPVKPRGPCKRYTAHQIGKLYDIVIEEGKTAKEAALVTGINIRTAQHYIKKYNDDEERRLPVTVRKLGAGRKARLTEAHSQFLIEYVNQYPAAVLSDIRQNLCEAFPGLSISISALHRYLVRKCKLTLEKLEKLHAARNSDRVL
jgi:transposase